MNSGLRELNLVICCTKSPGIFADEVYLLSDDRAFK